VEEENMVEEGENAERRKKKKKENKEKIGGSGK